MRLASKLHLGERGPRMVFLTSVASAKKNSFRSSETEAGGKMERKSIPAALIVIF